MLAPGVRILATLLVATAAGACTAAQPPAAVSPTAAPASIASGGGAPAARDPLRVMYVTLNGAMGPLWVAREAGIFANNGIDVDNPADDGPAGISVFSAVVPIPHTVIAANRISNEHYGIVTMNAVQLSGLPSNKFAKSVDIPTSIH